MAKGTVDCLADIESILTKAGVSTATADAAAIVDAIGGDATEEGRESRALAMAAERARGMPLAYIIGRVRFMGVELMTAPGALVPREETELLGRTAVDILQTRPSTAAPRLIDMCCGAGNLVCGIASSVPSLKAWASDLTDGAVAVARANVNRLGLGGRVEVVQSDLFVDLASRGLEETIDVIVCNPPYISAGKLAGERAELLAHEPREAFDGGPYGVSIFQRVVRDALVFLKPGGTLLFEIGVGQERQVSRLFERTSSYEPAIAVNDRAGQPRVVAARKK